jgi:hypothetical protein
MPQPLALRHRQSTFRESARRERSVPLRAPAIALAIDPGMRQNPHVTAQEKE